MVHEYIDRMNAPGDKRPTWLNGIIQIHITRACDMSCIGCHQGSNLAGKPVMMDLHQFEIACTTLQDYYGVVGVFGGNPTVHPQFEEICRILERIIPFERRGLFSNNLNGYGKLCREIFNPEFANLNVHCSQSALDEIIRDWPEAHPKGLSDSRHSPPYVAMKDIVDLTEEQKWELITTCDVNKFWSALIGVFRGDLRAWFCELSGAQSMLHQNEEDYPDTGIRVDKGWWKLPIGIFANQVRKHCMDCGFPLRGFGDLATNGTKEHVSKTHLPIYNLKKPNGKEVVIVDSIKQLGGHVMRATDYIENGENMSEARVLIGVPTQEFARQAVFYDYFNMLEKPIGTICTFSHGQSPARNRNLIIQQALENNCTHILFLDDDTAVKPDLLVKLLKHDVDIVTGYYLMRNYPHSPIIFDYADEVGRCRHYYPQDGDHGLKQIVACGLGACLIKTHVFQVMRLKGLADDNTWVRLGELEKDHWCDDISFFRRAREAGFKMYCDLDCSVGHMATVTIWGARSEGKWQTMYDTGGTSRVSFPSVKPTAEMLASVK